jgi:hypothetical protein
MPRCQRLEAFQVVGQPVNQFVLETNGAVLRHCSNNVNSHFFVRFYFAKVRKVRRKSEGETINIVNYLVCLEYNF